MPLYCPAKAFLILLCSIVFMNLNYDIIFVFPRNERKTSDYTKRMPNKKCTKQKLITKQCYHRAKAQRKLSVSQKSFVFDIFFCSSSFTFYSKLQILSLKINLKIISNVHRVLDSRMNPRLTSLSVPSTTNFFHPPLNEQKR